jgi:hypothetical protein
VTVRRLGYLAAAMDARKREDAAGPGRPCAKIAPSNDGALTAAGDIGFRLRRSWQDDPGRASCVACAGLGGRL